VKDGSDGDDDFIGKFGNDCSHKDLTVEINSK
jgi:hypothetical protein